MYAVEASQRVQKFLDKLDQHLRERIEERLKKLGEIHIPSDAKFISRDEEGNKIFRYRIGDYRALYLVKDGEDLILIVKVGKRSRIYD
ncbi:MAG TPA: type II toxin-antitoxin system RelE/ParE family toxin [Candidatus Nanoarchaeia archaeon]|nr:type II toxin-antitoxin system RelE/ParE family toxin [Candidatus Nanoarchaeia archaeon]